MIFAVLLFLTGITLSAVAIYYSVIGLTSIFAAAFWPVVVMGTTLEISKLVAASWLKAYWEQIPRFMKIYMSVAVLVLMLITSMGIFGFLSKAHSDQSLVSGDVQSKISVYDEKIKTARDNIEANRKALAQLDSQVDQVLGRTDDARGAERAVQIRRNQAKERATLQNEIAQNQTIIAKLNEEAAPIRAEVRKVEAEVGPIKYIAKLIYGDDSDTNLLEKAVTWVIMVIVFVFDPMAILLLLGGQMTYQWHRKKSQPETEPVVTEVPESTIPWPVGLRNPDPDDAIRSMENTATDSKLKLSDILTASNSVAANPKESESQSSAIDDETALDQWNKMIEEAERAVREELEEDETQYIDSVDRPEKEAMARWKFAHPQDSLKRQRKMFDQGVLTTLPWMVEPYYITGEMSTDEVAQSYNDITNSEEPEPSQGIKLSDLKKKDLTYLEKIGQNQIQKTLK
jgi:hypothetical protein